MINLLAKSMVLIHAALSLVGMGWAIMIVLEDRDLGRLDPIAEYTDYNADGTPKGAKIRYASEYDRSYAAVQDVAKTGQSDLRLR